MAPCPVGAKHSSLHEQKKRYLERPHSLLIFFIKQQAGSMKKDSIVQYVCFATKLEPAEFSPLWKEFAKRFTHASSISLYEVPKKDKSRFRYISRLTSKGSDFRFAFMKERNSDHFPEQAAKVIQLGGYSPIQVQTKKTTKKDVKVLAFLDKNNFDVDFCQQQQYISLDIYEAYFENCRYSYIMEYYVQEKELPLLLEQLSAHGGIEVTHYINPLVNTAS
jgi:hypothetical protein